MMTTKFTLEVYTDSKLTEDQKKWIAARLEEVVERSIVEMPDEYVPIDADVTSVECGFITL
jgi:hypothetical protein